MIVFVFQLPAKEKLELYKKFKGYCFSEGGTAAWNVNEFKPILDEKAKDVYGVLDYELYINPLEVYKDYVNGRIR